MKRIYIYGAGKNGQKAYDLLNAESNWNDEYQFKGFCDLFKSGEFLNHKIYNPQQIPTDSVVVLAISDEDSMIEMYDVAYEHGIRDIYWFSGMSKTKSGSLLEQCVDCHNWGGVVVKHVEINLANHCNLNCKCCSHFSALFKPGFPTEEQLESDLMGVKKKFTHILNLYLMGGEPLLNKEIGNIVRRVRNIFPDTKIVIVTNGLLLPSLSSDVLEVIKDNSVYVDVSEYTPTKKIIHRIREVLDKHGIIYEIKEMKSDGFYKLLSISNNSKHQKGCLADGCYDVWEGKIARCPMLMYLDIFNQFFGTSLPRDGVYDLDSNISGKELKNKLKEQVPLCAHCIPQKVQWEQCGKQPQLADFAERD